MSQENAEIVRAVFEAWNAGDMDAVRELYEIWDADDLELINHSIDVGDRVAVRFIWHVAGRGPETDLELSQVATMRKGRVFYIEFFWDHAEALEALGLSEQDAPSTSP